MTASVLVLVSSIFLGVQIVHSMFCRFSVFANISPCSGYGVIIVVCIFLN